MIQRLVLVLVFTLIAVLGGCSTTEYSQVLTEDTEISEVLYVQPTSTSGAAQGVSSNGAVVFSFGEFYTPESFTVVFTFAHGKCVTRRKDVWEKSKVGMKGLIRYREEYLVSGGECTLVGCDFIDFGPKA